MIPYVALLSSQLRSFHQYCPPLSIGLGSRCCLHNDFSSIYIPPITDLPMRYPSSFCLMQCDKYWIIRRAHKIKNQRHCSLRTLHNPSLVSWRSESLSHSSLSPPLSPHLFLQAFISSSSLHHFEKANH